VFEKEVLRRMFGPERKEITGGWDILHKEELHNLHSSLNIRMIKIRRTRWEGHVTGMRKMRNAYKICRKI
jgi:hypothetical protein